MAAALVKPAASAPPDDIRQGVRALLTAAEGYHALDDGTRRDIAASLVRISSTARTLAADAGTPPPPVMTPRLVLARAQNAGSEFSGVAADRVAGTTRAILNAVSFPRFVNELITGVFKAMNDSNQQQLTAFVELIRNVAATTEGFANANMGDSGARNWLAERFPGSFVVQGGGEDEGFPDAPGSLTPEERAERQAERDAATRLALRPGASMPSEGALRTALGLPEGESVPAGNPEGLVGLARAALARNRQQMLATMVMMGLQRIVIDSGRINASMRFHIDTRSAANDDRGSTFDMRNTTEVGAHGSVGVWGAEAKMQNTIGYVSTERTQTTEEMNTELDLNSSVELIFRSDYVPLERLAGTGDVDRIRVNSLNPDAEDQRAMEERRARREAQGTAERARADQINQRTAPPPPLPAPTVSTGPSPAPAPSRTSMSSGGTSGTGGASGTGGTGGTSTTAAPTTTTPTATAPATGGTTTTPPATTGGGTTAPSTTTPH